MSEARDGRMRLTVLGGFLGSGKTTWLRHQLHHGQMKDALVIVNEAAEVPVDDALLARSAELRVLAGGCACCDGREALVTLLRAICDARVGGDDALASLDRVVLETSGLADPGPIVDTIRTDPVLIHHLMVDEIIIAIDALYGLDQMRNEPLTLRQIETADRLLVTKVDAAAGPDLARLVATLHALNPGAAIAGAAMGSGAGLPDHAGIEPVAIPPAQGEGAAAPIAATRLDLSEATDWPAFSIWLSALLHARGDDIMRVKGVVRTPAGRLLLQSVRKVVQQPEIVPEAGAKATDDDNSVVVIGRGFRAEDLRRSLAYFTGEGR
ncbi:CobW family GTP-binding protein [Nitratireductor sp. StC3]|uniref:CobW family GTP-binding protein n=1 Tax=Nitratireductor sp. StC3 TaxID=2126741 RepID=UPI000D0D496B|nr:CobW family GTP-binding protein [Nitratireductor sp. StC3]PSM16156.1 GTP-binding protein [Nitratireductor sp. StC3]